MFNASAQAAAQYLATRHAESLSMYVARSLADTCAGVTERSPLVVFPYF